MIDSFVDSVVHHSQFFFSFFFFHFSWASNDQSWQNDLVGGSFDSSSSPSVAVANYNRPRANTFNVLCSIAEKANFDLAAQNGPDCLGFPWGEPTFNTDCIDDEHKFKCCADA